MVREALRRSLTCVKAVTAEGRKEERKTGKGGIRKEGKVEE